MRDLTGIRARLQQYPHGVDESTLDRNLQRGETVDIDILQLR